jgi:nucleotide-binding universal stress UspA family protein
MKKILVPIDNSQLAKSAVIYAYNLAVNLKGEIILLSVINASPTSNTLVAWSTVEEELVAREREEVANMVRDVRQIAGAGVKITHKHVLGYRVPDAINGFVLENKIDLVVMGTAGARGVRKFLAGTNTASVIDGCSVPVITVPRTTLAKAIRKIVYATDMLHMDEEIKTIAHFARSFNAEVDVVHLTADGHRNRNRSELEHLLIRLAKYPKIHLSVTKGIDIAKDLRAFASKHKADMIVMFTHELDFFEKLFGKGNTRQVAYESTVPLLAFNRTKSHL